MACASARAGIPQDVGKWPSLVFADTPSGTIGSLRALYQHQILSELLCARLVPLDTSVAVACPALQQG